MSLIIRQARTSDIKNIRAIIDEYAAGRRLLTKETVTLYESVQEFTVAEIDGKVVGCGAMHVLWEDLAEVRSVAVDQSVRGKGVGHGILEVLIKRAAELGIKRIFAHGAILTERKASHTFHVVRHRK